MRVEAHDLTVRIDGRDVVSSASLTCNPGTMTALVGPSGSGKTTLLHCLGLLQAPTTGRVLLDGADATGWKPSRRRRFWKDQAAFVLQNHGVMEEESWPSTSPCPQARSAAASAATTNACRPHSTRSA